MRQLGKLITFVPWWMVGVDALLAVYVAVYVAVYTHQGNYVGVARAVPLTIILAGVATLGARGRWQHRRLIGLRNQLQRRLKRRLADARQMLLVSEDNKTAVLCTSGRVLGMRRYSLMVRIADSETDSAADWNLAFTQRAGLLKLQEFQLPPLLRMVETDMWLAADFEDLPRDDPRHQLSPSYMRDRMRRLGMDAAMASAEELTWLLQLVSTGTPQALPDDED